MRGFAFVQFPGHPPVQLFIVEIVEQKDDLVDEPVLRRCLMDTILPGLFSTKPVRISECDAAGLHRENHADYLIPDGAEALRLNCAS